MKLIKASLIVILVALFVVSISILCTKCTTNKRYPVCPYCGTQIEIPSAHNLRSTSTAGHHYFYCPKCKCTVAGDNIKWITLCTDETN